jgi:hypothetical protein
MTKTKRPKAKPSEPRQETSSPKPSEPPPPDMLFKLAEEEPDRMALEEYINTIRLLRDDKRFTFREIAEWLKENGVETDHNAVYRAYRRHVPPEHQDELDRDVAQEDER